VGKSLREMVVGLFRRGAERAQPLHAGFYRICNVCGHGWYARQVARPKRCPSPTCQSRRWDRPPKGHHGATEPEQAHEAHADVTRAGTSNGPQ